MDLGCRQTSLEWLRRHGVSVIHGNNGVMGRLSDSQLGYHRAQTCRPFLPELFPDADVLCWIDCDTWFQDSAILDILFREAEEHRNSILVSPEIHYTYSRVNDETRTSQMELHGYYEALYGQKLADELYLMPTVNSGFFVMHRTNTLWERWKRELENIYVRDFHRYDVTTRHFAEQTSLNMLLKTGCCARYFDPIYNYLCLWNPPFCDEQGVVRLSAPPFQPVGMLHLAGGWRYFGRTYSERGLLYKKGEYLNGAEKLALLKAFGVVGIVDT